MLSSMRVVFQNQRDEPQSHNIPNDYKNKQPNRILPTKALDFVLGLAVEFLKTLFK